jgi:hypothetical protein
MIRLNPLANKEFRRLRLFDQATHGGTLLFRLASAARGAGGIV